MGNLSRANTVSVSIDRAPQEVYDYIIDVRNLPKWVPSFAQSVREENGALIVETEEGDATFAFVPRNPLLVADHEVRRGGVTAVNPLRVIPNGDGAEVVFTVIQEGGQPDAAFEDLAELVHSELGLLKAELEG